MPADFAPSSTGLQNAQRQRRSFASGYAAYDPIDRANSKSALDEISSRMATIEAAVRSRRSSRSRTESRIPGRADAQGPHEEGDTEEAPPQSLVEQLDELKQSQAKSEAMIASLVEAVHALRRDVLQSGAGASLPVL